MCVQRAREVRWDGNRDLTAGIRNTDVIDGLNESCCNDKGEKVYLDSPS